MSLLDPAILRGFEACRTNNAWPERQKTWFSFRKGQERHNTSNSGSSDPAGERFFDMRCETGQSSVHRARFLDELVKLVPERVAHFGKRLDSVQEDEEGVMLTFGDGTTARHTAVIGCDGVKSRVRAMVLGAEHPATRPSFSGKYAYRGLIPMERAAEMIGEEVSVNATMYVGEGGHMLTFPIEHGKTMNVVAFQTKKDRKWEEGKEWVQTVDRETMLRDFDGWVPTVKNILHMMERTDLWALFDHPPAPTYHKGRICILGDSAHASTPHQGAGAGQAIEDALIMSRAMARAYTPEDAERAFAVYDRLRRPRSQRQVRTAREGGELYDLMLPGVGDDWEEVKRNLSTSRKWIWEHDLGADVGEAERLMDEGRARL